MIAYFWQTERATTGHSVWHEGAGFEREQEIAGLRDWAFCVGFDAQDRVLRQATLMVTDGHSIKEEVTRWASNGERTPEREPPGPVWP